MYVMNLPIMLYDDTCKLCHRFARTVDALASGRLTIVGHYTPEGKRIREEILDDAATEMFWVIDKRGAYGGRAAILPLIRSILTTKGGLGMSHDDAKCSDACSIFLRSYSLITHSKHISFDAPRRNI
ncbi:MAG: DUF393 domain-containing protein [Cenarchaeum sp. SB0661_bin_35]|nr:DUF393 domain-containing protein [Cenarchaeum sp. SB0667_bin_13]MYC79487.1 DUF393 domain-containing protein [Cenarchaeum sp. SB0661_bin_35]MYI51203.1 DUF393 domain-containing protein [Cenarchaeum sp. SB0673_bin_9]